MAQYLQLGAYQMSGCAARQNFNVVRMFGFPVQRGFNLQTSAGVYNEQVRTCCGVCYRTILKRLSY